MSPKFVHQDQIYNMSALINLVGWRITGDAPLSEPMNEHMKTQFADIYMVHAWMGKLHENVS